MNKSIDIYIEGKRLELFEDENFVVNSSVQNVNDISKLFTDYSQGLTVPASKNNSIFKHFYNADIDFGYDGRTKKRANIEISKMPFKDGNIVLESVNMKNNRPESYNITFYGNLVNLTDLFGDDLLSDLDWSQYDHSYNVNTVQTGLTIGLFSQDLIYPLISSTRQWYYNSSASDHTNEEKSVNVAYHFSHSTGEAHGFEWTELKPAIKVRAILEKIQQNYGITFSDDFFSTEVLDNLYMWLSNSKGKLFEGEETGINLIDFDSRVSGNPIFDLVTDSYTTTLVSSSQFSGFPSGTQRITGSLTVTPDAAYNDVNYSTYRITVEGGSYILQNEDVTGQNSHAFTTRLLQDGTFDYKFTFYVEADTFMEYSVELTLTKQQWNGSSWFTVEEETVSGSDIGTTDNLSLGAVFNTMKVKDFMTSIVKMYNLVIVPTSNTDFYIDLLDNWYEKGKTIDITKYVDISTHTVSKGNVLNNLKFKFKEDSTILIDEFKNQFGYQYGNLETDIKDSNGQKLDGKVLNIESSFGNMIFERLVDRSNGNLTDVQYGTAIDSNLDPINPNPLLFYGIKKNIDSDLSLLEGEDDQRRIGTSVFMPSHVNDFSTKEYSTVFNAELDEYDTQLINNSLYKLFYEDYITDILDEKRRLYSYSAKLPDYLLSSIKLNDKLVIKDVRYIINDMEINLTKNEVKLELLNDIYSVDKKVPITLTSGTSSSQACDNNDFTTYYLDQGVTFENANVLYSDINGNSTPDAKIYSNGIMARFWDKLNNQLIGNTLCSNVT
ncbi:hypothetical protein [Costertonia aggregata]|uniref:Uncharacterized protein n=1 Tax=Costertonia aggregata TaxID=343403 RepID=A0A7H9ARI9_9FLAO|nr:hypothetical protein [Costertonia aggregata]QLG46050.1 hypothetical protein HYG79_12075 [Costertonia aggregata]